MYIIFLNVYVCVCVFLIVIILKMTFPKSKHVAHLDT
jgi:hypothetical protein